MGAWIGIFGLDGGATEIVLLAVTVPFGPLHVSMNVVLFVAEAFVLPEVGREVSKVVALTSGLVEPVHEVTFDAFQERPMFAPEEYASALAVSVAVGVG